MDLAEALRTREEWVAAGKEVVAATVVSARGSTPRPVGARFLLSSDGDTAGSVSGGCVESDVALHAGAVLEGGPPVVVEYGISDEQAFGVGLACGGTIRVLVDRW